MPVNSTGVGHVKDLDEPEQAPTHLSQYDAAVLVQIVPPVHHTGIHVCLV